MEMTRNKYPRKLTTSGKTQVIYKKTELPNGLRVITEELASVDSFALGVNIDIGSRDDLRNKEGIAHFLEHAVFLRTQNRSSRQISAQFESLGAYANAFTTKEQTCFYVRALGSHFRKSFEILADVALNPRMVEKEFEKERQVIIEEIKSYEDDPEELICDYIEKQLFEGNPLSHPIAGYEDSVGRITIDDVARFHHDAYNPRNIIVSAAGCIPHETVVQEAARYFGSLPKGKSNIILREPVLTETVTRFEADKPFSQCHITLGKIIPGVDSIDRYPLALLNVILGDGMSSRLYHQLRERHGYAYAVYSSIQHMSDTGTFSVYSTAERKNVNKILRIVREEFCRLIESKIPGTEVRRAKEQVKSSTIMALESLYTRMTNLAKSEFSIGTYEDIDSTIEAVETVTAGQIKDCAARYLDFDKWSTVIFYDEED